MKVINCLSKNWVNELLDWVSRSIMDEQAANNLLYLLLVCEDMEYVKETVNNSIKYATQLIAVDCRERDVEEELSHFFGAKGSFSLMYVLIKFVCFLDTAKEVKATKTLGSKIFLVTNAHLLSEYHRLHVASVTVAAGCRFILAMPSFNPETLTLKIKMSNHIRSLHVSFVAIFFCC